MNKLKIAGVIAGLLVLPLALGGYSLAVRYFSAPIKGVVEQQEITNRGAYRMQEYDRFYRLQEQATATRTKIAALGSIDTPREAQTCRGLAAVLANQVAEYNAAARAVETSGKWRAPDLSPTLTMEIPSC